MSGLGGRGAAALAVVVLLLAALPWLGGAGTTRLATELLCYLTLAQLWNLLAGFAGLVSVGQHAYVGLGGCTLFGLVLTAGIGPLWALPAAAALCALAALPAALLLFRLQGVYFSIGTWVVAAAWEELVALLPDLGGGSGISLPAAVTRELAASRALREQLIYGLALAVALGVLVLVWLFLRSRLGLALRAMRDDTLAAAGAGVDVRRMRLLVYVLAAAGGGVVGVILFLGKLRISPESAFSLLDWTGFVLFIVIIGGIGTIMGPIVGTVLFFGLREILAGLGAWYLVLLGTVAVATMIFAPQGLWGWVAARWRIPPFSTSRFPSKPVTTGNRPGSKRSG